jgi:aminoglycoside phosphotransferase
VEGVPCERRSQLHPFDHYQPWRLPDHVDEFQRALILNAYPPESEIVDIRSYRPGYMAYPFCVQIRLPSGEMSVCVLKANPLIGGVEREGKVLPVLARLGLPVPSVLAGPAFHPGYPSAGAFLVLSELPGKPLPWIDVTLEEADLTCWLHQQAVARLHGLTEQILGEDVSQILPKRTLIDELEGIVARGGPWFDVPIFVQAMQRLRPILESIGTPLVFSNGDYNPLNFLHKGAELTGWIDFTNACFEDPHIGFAKFVIWSFDVLGWGTGARAGLVERYLYSQDVSRSEFAPRLAVRCLYRLQRDTTVDGEQDAFYRQAILRVLDTALRSF